MNPFPSLWRNTIMPAHLLTYIYFSQVLFKSASQYIEHMQRTDSKTALPFDSSFAAVSMMYSLFCTDLWMKEDGRKKKVLTSVRRLTTARVIICQRRATPCWCRSWTHTRARARDRARAHTHTHTHTHTRARAHTHTHARARTHTHTHTHTLPW